MSLAIIHSFVISTLQSTPKNLTLRGDNHTQTATPNINSALNYIPIYPALQMSNVATLKIMILSKNTHIQVFAIALPTLIPCQH